MSNPKDEDVRGESPPARGMFFTSLGCLIVGTAGYFTLERGAWDFYASSHFGALGLMGVFGVAAGVLASKKSRDYWRAFYLGSVVPVAAGAVAVLALYLGKERQLYCGGSICLLVALTVLLGYALARRQVAPPGFAEIFSAN